MKLVLIKILTWMASPTGFFIWGLALAGLIRWLRRKKTSVVLAAIAVGQVALFCTPFISDGLLGELEDRARILESQNSKTVQPPRSVNAYGAIVILGGAVGSAYPPKRPHPDLMDSSDRIWHGARLFKQKLAPMVIVSGGKGPGLEDRADIPSEAQSMRIFLVNFGIPPDAIVLEEKSRTTKENAAFVKELVGDKPVALVTSAAHMPRALANFKKAGVDADAYPTDFKAIPEMRANWERWLPTGASLQRSESTLKEYLALFMGY